MPIAHGTRSATKETSRSVETEAGTFTFDFIIFATGVRDGPFGPFRACPDRSPNCALARPVHASARRGERFARETSLPRPAFEFMEREPGTAPFLARLHNFTFGAMPSLGLTGAAITGMKYGVPRLVNGLVRDLFREDAAAYYRDLLAYAVPELETLESASAWIDRLASRRSARQADRSSRPSRARQSARRTRVARPQCRRRTCRTRVTVQREPSLLATLTKKSPVPTTVRANAVAKSPAGRRSAREARMQRALELPSAQSTWAGYAPAASQRP